MVEKNKDKFDEAFEGSYHKYRADVSVYVCG